MSISDRPMKNEFAKKVGISKKISFFAAAAVVLFWQKTNSFEPAREN
jgi:hypothetical protein